MKGPGPKQKMSVNLNKQSLNDFDAISMGFCTVFSSQFFIQHIYVTIKCLITTKCIHNQSLVVFVVNFFRFQI